MNSLPTRIDDIDCGVYRFPTDRPESDGTLTWDATTAVVVRITANGECGTGWTYSSSAAAAVVTAELAPLLLGQSPFDVAAARAAMYRHCRNYGIKGLVSQAISAIDIALWDLKARLHNLPLTTLFGMVRDRVPVYGSGGFTSLDEHELDEQVKIWTQAGCQAIKIKIGKNRGAELTWDIDRVQRLHEYLGGQADLMVDANGAYTVAHACRVGAELDRLGVTWFEEPVTSDDPTGLAAVRSSVDCDVTAGEYISDRYDAAALLPAVDCLQLDVTRCGGYTGFMRLAAVAARHGLDVSAHCAPALHAPVAAAVPNLRHVEWFIDHTRLEPILANEIPSVSDGHLHAPTRTPGHGMTLAATAQPYRRG